MNLLESTQKALDFTGRLKAALALNELDLCQEILELRGLAMSAFEESHRRAGAREKAGCQEAIDALVQADKELQEITAANLNSVARDFRENTVSNMQGSHQLYQDGSTSACIDRKA